MTKYLESVAPPLEQRRENRGVGEGLPDLIGYSDDGDAMELGRRHAVKILRLSGRGVKRVVTGAGHCGDTGLS